MEPPALLSLTRRARRDIDECVRYVSRFPRGKPEDRRRDIYRGLNAICASPERSRVEVRRRCSGIELRRYPAAQFVIVYTFFAPTEACPAGLVSVRAVQHWRMRDVFFGVRDGNTPDYRTV
jgi:plasmid stabilization system protein ParE